jgi:hypothetical protein
VSEAQKGALAALAVIGVLVVMIVAWAIRAAL